MVVEGSRAIALEWTFFCLAGAFVSLRVYTRWSKLHVISKPDWIVLMSYCTFCSTVVIDTLSSAQGFFDKDVTYNSDLSTVVRNPKELVKLLKLLFISAFPYIMTLYGVKVIFILLYYTLIPITQPKLRILLHITTVILICGFITSMTLNVFWCLPIQRNWSTISQSDTNNKNSQCFAYASLPPYFVTTGFHILLDGLIFIIPFPLLKSLKLGRREYYGVVGIFAAGGLCILATAARTAAIGLEANTAQVGVWTSLEQCTALIVVSMPALKAFVVSRSRNGSSMRNQQYGSSGRQRSTGGVIPHMASNIEAGKSDMSRSGREMGTEGGPWIRLNSPTSTRSRDLDEDIKQHEEVQEVAVPTAYETVRTREDPKLEMAIQQYELSQQISPPVQLKMQRDSGNKFSIVRT